MVDRVDMVETVELVDAVDMGVTVVMVEMVDLWAGIELTRAMAGMCKMKMKHLLSLINNPLSRTAFGVHPVDPAHNMYGDW